MGSFGLGLHFRVSLVPAGLHMNAYGELRPASAAASAQASLEQRLPALNARSQMSLKDGYEVYAPGFSEL